MFFKVWSSFSIVTVNLLSYISLQILFFDLFFELINYIIILGFLFFFLF